MVDSLKDFMPKMGTGSRTSEDLSYPEAREAMEFLLDEDVDPTSFGAFTVAERWKGQDPEELAGFLDEIRSNHTKVTDSDGGDFLDVSGRFDGKVDSANTEFAGSLLAVAAGARILNHSGRNVPTQEGATFLDLVDTLGWAVEPSLDLSRRALEEVGFAYTNPAVYAPRLDGIRNLRRSLGVRCFLNTIESMTNPFDASVHVGSFYHLSYASRVCDTFDRCETQSPERILMIQGIEGQTELRPGDCLMAEWCGGGLIEHDLHTGDMGLGFSRGDLEEIGADPERSTRLLEDLVEGRDVPEPYRESVTLNAGCRLYAADRVESFEEGLEEARRVLDKGRQRKTWSQLKDVFRHG